MKAHSASPLVFFLGLIVALNDVENAHKTEILELCINFAFVFQPQKTSKRTDSIIVIKSSGRGQCVQASWQTMSKSL